MERSEPSLIPEWLKGAVGGGSTATQSDDAGSLLASRHRLIQQSNLSAGSNIDFDSPRGSTSSDRAFSSSRRGHASNSSASGSTDRANNERESYILGRSHSSLTRSSSNRNHESSERDRDVFKGDSGRDWEADRDNRANKERPSFGQEDRERDRDRLENGMIRLSTVGKAGKYETEAKLKRSQSMGIASRASDSGVRKHGEAGNLPSGLSSNLASSIQKAAFERNFPSLGAEERIGGLLTSPGNPSISSPRPLWQGPSRMDLSRASSPGLPASYGGPISTTSTFGSGVDLWSSALAEVPSSNGSMAVNSSTTNVIPISSSGLTSALSSVPVTAAPVTALNMAEALTQIPPRVRTPPQLSVETQRLEELALKQSRQLIPMTPSLPKTMSLADKNKSKSTRSIDTGSKTLGKANLSLGLTQISSSHRPLTPVSKPDTPKQSQGKLLLLKSSKDGITLKPDGSNGPQVTSAGNTSPATSGTITGTTSQRKPSHDRRSGGAGLDGMANARSKDCPEDKRASIQAQNRSDFFNTLRKKAAGNGNTFCANSSSSSVETKKNAVSMSKAVMVPEGSSDALGNGSELKENGGPQEFISCQPVCEIHSNGDGNHSVGNGSSILEAGGLLNEPFTVSSSTCIPLPADSEEEEAAFMRSLGWEENAEGSELTEEEINAFYQMREKKRLLNTRGQFKSVVDQVGSLGSMSSGLSSSDSESDNELHM